MPNRILKESICSSDTIENLTWFEEVVFYRLMVNCDDYGRFDGRAPIITSRLFPLKRSVTEKSVMSAIDKLSNVGLIRLYECDGKSYLHLTTWDKHQQVRAKKSKYPAPPEKKASCNQMISDDIKCNHMKSYVPVIQSNPIQSESESEGGNTRVCAREDTAVKETPLQNQRFDEFWSIYPKKVGKKAALKAWKRINPDKELFGKIADAVNHAVNSEQWRIENGRFIPNPATWLNQGRWDDELLSLSKPKSSSSSNASYDLDEFRRKSITEPLVYTGRKGK